MARLAYVAHGLRGSLYNSLALARRLRADGHDFTLLSFRDVASDAEANGIDFIHLSDGPEAWSRVHASMAARGRLRSLPTALRSRRAVVSSTEVRDVVKRLGADLVLADAEMHGAILQLHAAGQRLATVVPWHSIFHEPGLPPMHTELRPDAGRQVIDEAWQLLHERRARGERFGRFDLGRMATRLGPFHLNSPDPVDIAAVAGRHEVDVAALSSKREWMHPHAWTAFPTISYTAGEFDFAASPPPTFHHIGPLIDDDRPEPLVSAEDVERWTAFLARTRGAGRKIAFCSMGSLQSGNADWYRAVIGAFAADPAWALVVGLGAQGQHTFASSDDLLVLDYAPQLRCLAESDVAIHTAGTGTFYECLNYEVPSIVLQTGFVDQPGIAARIVHFGLGVSLDAAAFDEQTILANADELVADREMANRLRTASGVLAGYDADHRAEQTIAVMLQGEKSRGR